jgi:Mg2+-importing ATPase
MMILLSTILKFCQEFRSNKAAQKLASIVRPTAFVSRNWMSNPEEIPTSHLVPGDIIYLSAGDLIPADIRVITAKDLFLNQSMLTGESLPVEKHPIGSPASNPLESEVLCLMGTSVVSGTAIAVVIATGEQTYLNSMSKTILKERPATSFDKGISKISWMLICFIIAITPLVFLLNGFIKGNWIESLLFAASIAVGLTPEMLPMVVTTNLAKGAVAMAKCKTIVKNLGAIQNLGSMNILCTDKTGTLTQDKIILQRHIDPYGNDNIQVLEYAWLNSFHQTGLKNLLDMAVLKHEASQAIAEKMNSFYKVDEIPFDFTRRRMSVVLSNGTSNLLVCKGSVEEILSLCTITNDPITPEKMISFTKEKMTELIKLTNQFNQDGLRTLAIAYKWLPAQNLTYTIADEKDLTLSGYIAFLDPPKDGVFEAITALKSSGIDVKIITGDSDLITQKICKDIGLEVENIILGKEVEELSDELLADIVEKVTIFAKMSPLQKARIIKTLKSKGHIVGYLGDGVNDAAALKEADVGISVDTAVDIAKASSDIILLEKSLMVLQDGVIEGRKIFVNILKYITMATSSNFGNIFSIIIASIFLPFLPMLPIQLLIQNMLYDISQISIPWDNVDNDYLKIPHKWDVSNIVRFMLYIGPISSIFDVITFLIMWNVFGANSIEKQALFHSGWFVEGLLTQVLIIHMIRTKYVPLIQSSAATPIILLALAVMTIGIYIPFSTLGSQVGMVPLPKEYFYWLAGILFGYCTLIQIVKFFYIKKFGQWL